MLPPVPLIGRAAELTVLCDRLRQDGQRLLTLTGPPGVGKTLLAQHVAVALADVFDDGAVFVPLDPLRDPELVPAAIARALGARETRGQSLRECVLDHLREREMLLVLDNFEHVLAAAELVDALIARCPRLTVLVTSRAPLRLRAEVQIPLDPLALPLEAETAGEAAARDQEQRTEAYPSVQLFLMRLLAARPSFPISEEAVRHAATICARLDGLPLAIELAAARARVLSLAEIEERLTRRLALLTGGYQDLPERHRTLRAAIAWSYELLTPEEQRLFRLFGVFAGGATLDAVEAALPDADDDALGPILDALTALVDHSLLRREEEAGGRTRFRLLETIREYALNQLDAAGEAEAARSRLAAWYVAITEGAGGYATGPERAVWLERLDAEQDNLRAVLGWAASGGDAVQGLRIAAALWRYWSERGQITEGRRWLDRLLGHAEQVPVRVRAAALHGAGYLAVQQGDLPAACERLEASVDLFREAGERQELAEALDALGSARTYQRDYGAARAAYEEALRLAEELGDARRKAAVLAHLANAARRMGDLDTAEVSLRESLSVLREQGDTVTVAATLTNLGNLFHTQGRTDEAHGAYEEALLLARGLGHRWGTAICLHNLGTVASQGGAHSEGIDLLEQALALRRELGDRMGTISSLGNLAKVARRAGDLTRAQAAAAEALEQAVAGGAGLLPEVLAEHAALSAARAEWRRCALLSGAAAAQREGGESAPDPFDTDELDRLAELGRSALGARTYAELWADGAAMSLDDAVSLALARGAERGALSDESEAGTRSSAPPDGLTDREAEVLGLMAAGQSNRQIAARLVVSPRTIEHHLANIYGKIGARGRVDATAYAVRHGLIAAPDAEA